MQAFEPRDFAQGKHDEILNKSCEIPGDLQTKSTVKPLSISVQ